jgi:retinol dehydrogenase-14
MQGKTVVITGANSGIGLETAKQLAQLGAKLVLACRNMETGEQAATAVREASPNASVRAAEIDLGSLASIRKFVDDFKKSGDPIDVLINNAGLFPPSLRKTEDGFEQQIGVNYLGHFLLVNLLKDTLTASKARIVHVSSQLHKQGKIDFDSFKGEKKYSATDAYNQSKLANLLFSNEIAKRWAGTGVTSNALHPGAVRTSITRDANFIIRTIVRLMFIPVEKGAKTSVYVASAPELDGVSGKYFDDCKEAETGDVSRDEEMAAKLWDVSEKLVGIAALNT